MKPEVLIKYHAFCSRCLLAAGTTIATVPLVIPETYAAMRSLAGSVKGR
jgi:hypothetical protein